MVLVTPDSYICEYTTFLVSKNSSSKSSLRLWMTVLCLNGIVSCSSSPPLRQISPLGRAFCCLGEMFFLIILIAVFTFMGTEGMSAGPGLMFVSLPKVFQSMGAAGGVIGTIFFLMVSFAAITSSVSVMESIVSCMIDKFHISRKKSTVIVTVYACLVGIIVCLGYNALYFELKLPNGATAQILDVMDFISNNLLMPLVALLSCILIGWVVKPQVIIDEVTLGGYKFGRKRLYIVMVKFIAPVLLAALLLQSFGILNV